MESDNHVNVVNGRRCHHHHVVSPTYLSKKELKKILRQEQSQGSTSSRRRRQSRKHDDPFATVYYCDHVNACSTTGDDRECKNEFCLSDGLICLLVKKKNRRGRKERQLQHNKDEDICCCCRSEEATDEDGVLLSSVPVIFKTFPSRRCSRTRSKTNQRYCYHEQEGEEQTKVQNEKRKQTQSQSSVDVGVDVVPRLSIPPCIASSLGISSIELHERSSNGGAVSEEDGISFELCPMSSYKSMRDVPVAKVASLQKICTTTTLDNDGFIDQKDDGQFVQDIQHYFGTTRAPNGRLVNSNSIVGIPSSSGNNITYFKIRFVESSTTAATECSPHNKTPSSVEQSQKKSSQINDETNTTMDGNGTTRTNDDTHANIYIVSKETRLILDSSTCINNKFPASSSTTKEATTFSSHDFVVLPHSKQVLEYYYYSMRFSPACSLPSPYSLLRPLAETKKNQQQENINERHDKRTFTRELAERFLSVLQQDRVWHSNETQQHHATNRLSRNTVMMIQSSSSHFANNNNANQDIKERISEAAWAVGMTCLHIDGLAAFSYRYRRRQQQSQQSSSTVQMSGGGILDQINGVKAAFEMANSTEVHCVIHISNLEDEFTSVEQSLDPDALEDKERRFVTTVLDCLEDCHQPVVLLLSTNKSSFPSSSPIMRDLITSSSNNNILTLGPPTRQEAERLWKQHGHYRRRRRTKKKKTKASTIKNADQEEEEVDAQIERRNNNNYNDDDENEYKNLHLETLVMERVLDSFRTATELKCLRDEYYSTKQRYSPPHDRRACQTVTIEELKEQAKTIVDELRRRLSDNKHLINVDNSTITTTNTNIPKVYWEDVGGLAHVRQEIMDIIELPIKYPHLFVGQQHSSSSSKGILLYGPPGSGKTLVAKAIATECHIPFISIKGPELLGSYVGESEANIRRVFQEARQAARAHSAGNTRTLISPSVIVSHAVLFFDELDSLAPKRGKDSDGGGIMDRVSSTLLGELDGSTSDLNNGSSDTSSTMLSVIGATNRPDLLDTALLRPGRFDRHVYLGLSSAKQDKVQILSAQMRHFVFESNQSAKEIASSVVDDLLLGLSGADLSAVSSGAMKCCLRRICRDIEDEVLKRHAKPETTSTQETSPSSLYTIRREVMKEWNLSNNLEPRVSKQDILEAAQHVKPSVSTKDLAKYEALRNLFS